MTTKNGVPSDIDLAVAQSKYLLVQTGLKKAGRSKD